MARGVEVNGLADFGPGTSFTSTLGARRLLFDARRGRTNMARGQLVVLTPRTPLPKAPPRRPFVSACGPGGLPCMVPSAPAALAGMLAYGPAGGVAEVRGFGGLGALGMPNLIRTFGCNELDTMTARIKQALDTAESMNLTGPVVDVAREWYGTQTGFFTRVVVATGNDCTKDVQEAQNVLYNLNGAIANAGGTVPGTGEVAQARQQADVTGAGQGSDVGGTIRTVAIAAAVVAGVVGLIYVGSTAKAIFR